MSIVSIAAVGDLILDEPDPAYYLEPSYSLIRAADLAIGHLEVPHSDTDVQASNDVPAAASDPAAVKELAAAGFDVMTLAGNHIYDAGPEGLLDTVRHCRDAGLATVGAGRNLAEALKPAVLERAGTRIGVLSYNCVGPRESWATSQKPGAAYVKVLTHYELDYATPGGPPTVYTFVAPDSQRKMQRDITDLRTKVDVVIVALHKGIGHTPAVLADYEAPLAHAAVDAGADLVIAHHAHIMRGIEFYQGTPIFHGLGNFASVTRALSPEGDSPERAEWARRRVKLFGFSPDPAMPAYPFHPESRNTAIAMCRFEGRRLVSAGFIPCWIDDDARPVPQGRTEAGERVATYIADITRRAGFTTEFDWDGDQVLITPGPDLKDLP
jgi:poly-gamma-glutamate capsule biosynthesis protein CapA/YwtB (metallophosphatase superfamily)